MNGIRSSRFVAGWIAALVLALAPSLAAAQQTTTDSLRAQIQRMQRQLDSLQAVIARLPAPAADPIASIRAAAAAAAGMDTTRAAEPEAEAFESRQRNLSALNPEISVTGDVFAFSNSQSSTENVFVPREFEVALQSNLDPFSRAKVFVAFHSHGGEVLPFGEEEVEGEEGHEAEGHGFEVEIEEGYVEWLNLPGGLGVSVGRFRQRFGKYNRWHPHALPAQQLPLPYLAFLGEEGLVQTGVSLHWLVPLHGIGTYEVWGELTRSSAEPLYGHSSGLSGLGRINAFWDLSPATYFEIGLSGAAGDYEVEDADPAGPVPTANRLWGADFTLDWRPPARALDRQATLHGGVAVNRRVMTEDADLTAMGAFAVAELKFTRQWWAGFRYEYTEHPDDPDTHAWLIAPTLTWWQSEYVRLRAEYDVFRGADRRFGQLVLQVTFAMGPHKHETY
jgi:hypothetical protein